MLTRTNGLFWSEQGWVEGCCHHGDRIESLVSEVKYAPNAQVTNMATTPIFIPAPVDLHIHGAGGHDCMQGQDSILAMLKHAAICGTGALLATSVTAPTLQITAFLSDVKAIMHEQPSDGAVLLGAHLEGPFLNPDKLGAQPPFARALDLKQLETWLATGVVKVVTFAPEIDDDLQLVELCKRYGTRAQIGHTLCTWKQAQLALQRGCGVTHLFNAMSGVSARSGGAAVAALASAEFAEIITDGIHVDLAGFLAARRAIPQLYSVTDATAAAGMPDGDYQLGTYNVIKSGSTVRLKDGTLAGSCLTQLRSIEVLRRWGLGWHEIASLCSNRPARWVGMEPEFGQIERGSRANWLELRRDKLCARWHGGRRHALADDDTL